MFPSFLLFQLDHVTSVCVVLFASTLMHLNILLECLLEIFIRALHAPPLNRLHKLIHLPNLLIAHLIQQLLVELLPFPVVAF